MDRLIERKIQQQSKHSFFTHEPALLFLQSALLTCVSLCSCVTVCLWVFESLGLCLCQVECCSELLWLRLLGKNAALKFPATRVYTTPPLYFSVSVLSQIGRASCRERV